MNEFENSRINYLEKIKKNTKDFGIPQDYDLSLFDKLILLSSIFFIPLIYSFIFFILQITNSIGVDVYNSLSSINQYIFLLIVPAFGMIYGLFKFRKKMFEYKILGIFIATIGPIGIAFSIILNFIVPNVSNRDENIIFLVDTIIYGSLVVFFYLFKNKVFFEMLKKSFKKHLLITICIIVIGCLVYFLFNYVFSVIQNAVNRSSQVSNNQNQLNSYLYDPIGIAALFLSSVLFAPIIEEFSYRMIFMNLTNNRWYSYVLAILYFAFLHVQQTGDFQHIFTYFSLGIVNGFIFWCFKNLSPCIAVHSLTNLITFIILISQL